MSKDVWNKLESHTNAAEQAGMKGYRTGIRVALLDAIRKYVERICLEHVSNAFTVATKWIFRILRSLTQEINTVSEMATVVRSP